ncbi:MAG TPA: GNAT family protein [Candidatus Acidoferrum sp.]|nr:GNAT family protein [Candidatus Acidoferrum sp.]
MPGELPPEVLARRERLPRKPAAVDLLGGRVRLRPLELALDVPALHAVSSGRAVEIGGRAVADHDADALIWRYMSGGPFADQAGLAAWLGELVDDPDGLPLCVLDAATDRPVGVACYLANHPEHLKIELGAIWYTPAVQGAGANTEATYLMLEHAFSLGYRRVEWKCDALNERSRRSALRMGFRFEGIQEAHYIVKGRNRDTAWFRMLDREWPEIEPRLRALVG